MKISDSSLKQIIVFVALALLFFWDTGSLFAENASMIQIGRAPGENKNLIIEPSDLLIQKGTTVIWINGVQDEEIQVVFKDGKACKDVSFSPELRGFSINSKSCFVTGFIPYPATSSLQFTEKGTFEYSVSNANGKLSGKGKITIQDK